jgi:hypothetical protein
VRSEERGVKKRRREGVEISNYLYPISNDYVVLGNYGELLWD